MRGLIHKPNFHNDFLHIYYKVGEKEKKERKRKLRKKLKQPVGVDKTRLVEKRHVFLNQLFC